MRIAIPALPIIALFIAGCVDRTTSPPIEEPLTSPEPRLPPGVTPTPKASALASSRASKGGEVTIYDPDGDRSYPRMIEKIDTAEEGRVLHLMFQRYLTDSSKCSEDHLEMGDLEAARKRGQIAPRVMSKVDGSFTAARTAQTLYVVFVGECNALHSDNGGSRVLVVTEGNRIVARVDDVSGTSIAGPFDLDGDGIEELLLESGFTNQGVSVGSASLVRLARTSVVAIKDFGQVYEDNCASMLASKKRDFSVIRAVTKPGSAPVFRVEKKTRPCSQ